MTQNVAVGQDGTRKLCVGQLPGRMNPSLYLWDPMNITVLANFQSEDKAEQAKAFLLGMVGARVVFVDTTELDQ